MNHSKTNEAEGIALTESERSPPHPVTHNVTGDLLEEVFACDEQKVGLNSRMSDYFWC